MRYFSYIILLSIILLNSCKQGGSIDMNKADLLNLTEDIAKSKLDLERIECIDEFQKDDPNAACFVALYSAEDFMERVERLKDFKNITGWRDDYGVASAAFQYQDIPREVGFNYIRPNEFWKLPQYNPLTSRKAEGYVSIIVTDDDPKTRQ